MKQLTSLLVIATLFFSSFGLAAKKGHKHKPHRNSASAKTSEKNKWNEVCQDLLDNSVKATLKLEKSVNKKKKISKNEFDTKIQNELMIVQLNAWVCALSTKEQIGVAAEELFLKDYSKLVQSKKL